MACEVGLEVNPVWHDFWIWIQAQIRVCENLKKASNAEGQIWEISQA